MQKTNQSSVNFPRFPATARISSREKRTLSSILNNNKEEEGVTNNMASSSSSPKMILPPLSPSQQQKQKQNNINNHRSNNHHQTFSSSSSSPSANVTHSLIAHFDKEIADASAVTSTSQQQRLVPTPNTTSNLSSVVASVLCDVTTRYATQNFSTNDQEVEQQRRYFFKVVERVSKEAEHCKSAAVFCDTLFLHVKQQIDTANSIATLSGSGENNNNNNNSLKSPLTPASNDDFAGLRIASACWALDVISRSNTSFSLLLQNIKRLIFPAVFVGYNAVDDICQSRSVSIPSLAGATSLITSAPYLVCDLFYQRYAKDQRRIRQLNIDQESRTVQLKKNKSGAGMIVRTLNRQIVGKVFRSWRGHCRRIKVERFARDIVRKHGFRESRATKLEAAFSRWKLLVEQNRNATLSERCHHLTHQLENAKGQFQLQCFRADKYLRVVEELREELRSARDTREELHKDNIRLQAQLEAIQVQAREKLEAHVSLLCNEIHRWRVWVKHQDQKAAERMEQGLQFCDRRVIQMMAQAKEKRDQALDGGTGGGGEGQSDSLNQSTSDGLHHQSTSANGISTMQMFENADAENRGGAAVAFTTNSGAGGGSSSSSSTSAAVAFSKTEAALLQWCSWCVQQCPISTLKAVTNFSNDFINGEVFIIIMNVASPHHVSLGLLQDAHPIRRIERALEAGRKAGLSSLPKVNDFAEGSADLIVLSVSEIFHLWASRQRLIAGDGEKDPSLLEKQQQQGKGGKKKKKQGGAASPKDENELDETQQQQQQQLSPEEEEQAKLEALLEEEKPPVVTASELPKFLDECNTYLEQYKESAKQTISKDRLLWKLELGALFRGAYIAKERQEGRQVTVLDRKDMIRFTKFQKTRFNNLQNRYRVPPLDYQGVPWVHFELQLDLLRESLHGFYPDLRRAFTYYCNGAATMASSGYWSFCNDIKAIDGRGGITRTHLDRIFVMANLEDISHASVDPMLSFEDDLINEAEAADDEENTETLLIPSEFVECLIRIADLRIPGKMLHEKFAIFMRDYVVPFSCKSETDKFRREINSTAILAVTDRFRKDLSKVFVHFSHRKSGSGNKTRYMSEKDFAYFAKESMLYSTSLDETAITQIFDNVASPTDDMKGKELLAHEFIDALVCVSFFKHPSPFIPLEKKIELTCINLLNFLRGRLKGLVTLSKVSEKKESTVMKESSGDVLMSTYSGGSPLLGSTQNMLSGNNTMTTTNNSSPVGSPPGVASPAGSMSPAG